MKYLRFASLAPLFFLVSGFTDCYKPVANSGLPKHIKTVAVPVFQFEARGLRYRIESRFTDAVIREVIRRGSGLKVRGSIEGADAVIEGNIRDFGFSGVLLDREGRARVQQDAPASRAEVRADPRVVRRLLEGGPAGQADEVVTGRGHGEMLGPRR